MAEKRTENSILRIVILHSASGQKTRSWYKVNEQKHYKSYS